MKKHILLILSFVFIMMFLSGCNKKDMFEEWTPEVETLPCVELNSGISVNNKKIWTRLELKKYTQIDDICEIYAIYNNRVYLSYNVKYEDESEIKYKINLVSVNLDDITDIETYYSGDIGHFKTDLDIDYYTKSHPCYLLNQYIDYCYRDGFFYDDKIVIRDSETLIEYDIKKNELNEYNPDEYDFPHFPYQYRVADDYQSIELSSDKGNILITYDDLERTAYGEEFAKLCKMYTWDYRNVRTRGFFKRVQYIDGRIFLICSVYDKWASIYAVVLEYDEATGDIYYVQSLNNGEPLYSEFYLLPVVE